MNRTVQLKSPSMKQMEGPYEACEKEMLGFFIKDIMTITLF